MRTRLPSALAMMAALTASGHAQNWAPQPPAPGVSFGVAGDLLGRSPTGLVGFDEVLGRTLLPAGSGWQSQASVVPARQFSTLVSNQVYTYLFGGVDPASGVYRNDLWRYQPLISDWEVMSAGGVGTPGPSPREGSKATIFDDGWTVLFFGGQDQNGLSNETWVMLPLGVAALPPWWFPQPTPPALTGRIRHALARAPNNRAILFGGDDGSLRGDTWLFELNGWTQYTGVGPPPAADCRMAYDIDRDITVLVHANGETWEWNGYVWRLVGASGAPQWSTPALVYTGGVGIAGEVLAVQRSAATATTVNWHYTPSPARFDTTLDATCQVPGYQALELRAFERSLPILGETFHLRITGVPPTSLLLGAIELPYPAQIFVPLGCGCATTLAGIDPIVTYLPFGGGTRDWLLPIAYVPALLNQPIALQGFVIDAANPCWLMATQVGEMICGL